MIFLEKTNMAFIKKLIFAPLFLIFFTLLIYQLSSIFKSYDFVLSLSLDSLIQLIIISIFICLSSFFFILTGSLALDWKLVLPLGLLSSLTPLLFFDTTTALIFGVGIFISLLLSFLALENTMKSYFTFQPITLFGPLIRHLSGLLIIVIALVYFLSINKLIVQKGFELPDSLIDAALKFSPVDQAAPNPQLSIPSEQLNELKKNPEALKQMGLDPKILDSLGSSNNKAIKTPADIANNLVKKTVKDQFQSFIKPYQSYIPFILAVLLFLTLQSLTSMLNLLVYPLLWSFFYILEKSGFIKFTTEMRPVKKMIV